MNYLLDKEKELMKLNAEIDERNKLIGNKESPQKKSSIPRGRNLKSRGNSRPVSRSASVNRNIKEKENESFLWAPLSNQNPENYIWAPISQEELLENVKDLPVNIKQKNPKKQEKLVETNNDISSGKDFEELSPKNDDSLHYEVFEEENRTTSSKGDQTQIRMLNVKIRGLETTLDKINFEKTELCQEKDQLEKDVKIAEDQRRRLDVTNRNLTTQLEKSKGELEDVRHKFSVLEEDNNLLKKEMDETRRESKKNLSKKSSSDIRLNRALEEAAKLRGQLLAAEREKKDAIDNGKKSIDELTMKTKFLEKQRNELLQGFKKQMELIDVLKRQKLHLEAAHVLKYTEEEFMQTLDWKPGSGSGASTSSAPVPEAQNQGVAATGK